MPNTACAKSRGTCAERPIDLHCGCSGSIAIALKAVFMNQLSRCNPLTSSSASSCVPVIAPLRRPRKNVSAAASTGRELSYVATQAPSDKRLRPITLSSSRHQGKPLTEIAANSLRMDSEKMCSRANPPSQSPRACAQHAAMLFMPTYCVSHRINKRPMLRCSDTCGQRIR